VIVSYKHFGRERGEEIGEVVIFDSEKVDADPVLAAGTEEVGGAMVTLVPFGHESPGITELGYKDPRRGRSHRRAARCPALRTLTEGAHTMTTRDREISQAIEPDDGLRTTYLEATATRRSRRSTHRRGRG
jgi:hypothetical protein